MDEFSTRKGKNGKEDDIEDGIVLKMRQLHLHSYL